MKLNISFDAEIPDIASRDEIYDWLRFSLEGSNTYVCRL